MIFAAGRSGGQKRSGGGKARADSKPETSDRHGSDPTYHALIAATPEPIALCRLTYGHDEQPVDWIFTAVNEPLSKLLGLSDVAGKSAVEVLPGVHAENPDILEACGRSVTTGKPQRVEAFLPSLGRWLDIRVSNPVPDHFLAMFEDVTERRRLEETLRLTRLTVKHAPESVHWVSGDGRVVYANDATCELLGYSREELESCYVWDLNPSLTPELFGESWNALIKERNVVRL